MVLQTTFDFVTFTHFKTLNNFSKTKIVTFVASRSHTMLFLLINILLRKALLSCLVMKVLVFQRRSVRFVIFLFIFRNMGVVLLLWMLLLLLLLCFINLEVFCCFFYDYYYSLHVVGTNFATKERCDGSLRRFDLTATKADFDWIYYVNVSFRENDLCLDMFRWKLQNLACVLINIRELQF